jgi:hypothetical protein
MTDRIPIIEAANLREELQAELCLPEADERLPAGIQSPAIVIRRHERSTSFGDSYGFPKATYIDGYDEAGNLITTSSLFERQSRIGRVWQTAVERWKIGRAESTIGKTALVNASIS